MKFNTVNGKIEKYDKSQGLQGTEFKYNSQCQLRDGRMMFGGVNGLTVFYPDSIRSSPVIPGVIFTDFKIFNESVIPGEKGSPLKKHINFSGYVRLNHKQSVFTIEFASIDYNSPGKNLYRYKLEGFDNKWIEAGNRNFVTYTNLDAGSYTFLLQGSNSDGVWNETPRKLTIRISPPWYKTMVAIVLFILTLAYLVYAYVKGREKQAIHDKIVLQQKIDEARAQLEGKANELDRQKEELRQRDEDEKDMRFFTEGVAKMSDIISKKRRNLEDLATSLVAELVRFVDASAGDIFVADDSDPGKIVLRAAGEFSFSTKTERKYLFEAGEGYIGTCYMEKKVVVIDNLPDNYVILRSGLGEVSLHHAVIVPVIQDTDCVGVIEIASFEKLPENKIKFIEKIAESLASVITIIKANERTNEMLEQNNIQSEELKAQEEEMRQNIEELKATQEISQKREKELTDELSAYTRQLKELQEEIKQHKPTGRAG
jgi:hypothetical protein